MKRTVILSLVIVSILIGSIAYQVTPSATFVQVAYAVEQKTDGCKMPTMTEMMNTSTLIGIGLFTTAFSEGTSYKLNAFKIGQFSVNETTIILKNLAMDFNYNGSQFHVALSLDSFRISRSGALLTLSATNFLFSVNASNAQGIAKLSGTLSELHGSVVCQTIGVKS